MSPPLLRAGTPAGRAVLLATVLGSGISFLDGTVVTVALPALTRDFGAGFDAVQWVIDAYALVLGALVLLGGDLGDLFGRRRIFVLGLCGFGVASAACGLAPSIVALSVARAAQGAFGALLVPGSLAILSSSFVAEDRGRMIGAWSGMAGIATAAGPFVGGLLVDHASWRWVFLINPALVVVALVVTMRSVPAVAPEHSAVPALRRIDVPGAALAIAGLALLIGGLIQAPRSGSGRIPLILGGSGAALLVLFVIVERHVRMPMLPLAVFRSRDFSVVNLCTVALYGPLGGGVFLVVLELQQVLHWSALASGVALLPTTVLMFLLSARAGRLAGRIGARPMMTAGAVIAAGGFLLLGSIGPGATYLGTVLPGVVVFGLGLSCFVAPLTSAAMAAVEDRLAGVASGVNNAAARVATALAVALIPLLAGLSSVQPGDAVGFTAAFHRAMLIAATSCVVAGGIAAVGLTGTAGRAAGAR